MTPKKLLTIGWDIDDTLTINSAATGFPVDTPNYENIAVYKWFQKQGHRMVCWSGGGAQYAKQWAEKLGLHADEFRDKCKENAGDVDLCFDDCDVDLATVNVKVKPCVSCDPVPSKEIFRVMD